MPIPDFQTVMLPLLRFASDQQEHAVREAVQILADEFGLAQDERDQLLPSGRQRTFDNRVAWGVSYLKQAGLLGSPARGRFLITGRGLEVLAAPPQRITIQYLAEISPEFRQFRAGSGRQRRKAEVARLTDGEVDDKTPEEQFEAANNSLLRALERELLDRVKSTTPEFFERIVLRLLVAMGYGGSLADASEHLGRSGDDGVDGVINEDPLGLDVVHVQAKRWADAPVRRPDVQSFAGSLEGQRSRKGVFITTSYFTTDARQYVERIEKRIVLIDGSELVRLMIEHNVGVEEVHKYQLLRLDESFFDESIA
jgi:restriction system protein